MCDLIVGERAIVAGEIGTVKPLLIPASRTPCVYCYLFQERFGVPARGKGRSMWFAEGREARCAAFEIRDGSGIVEVRESGERIAANNCHEERGLVKGNRRRRYSASFLVEGDEVVVSGVVKSREKTKQGERFVMAAPEGRHLEILVTRRALQPKG